MTSLRKLRFIQQRLNECCNKCKHVFCRLSFFTDWQMRHTQHNSKMFDFIYRLLSGKCQPGWTLLDSTCYMYHGGPMTYAQAKEFCHKVIDHLPRTQFLGLIMTFILHIILRSKFCFRILSNC